MARRRRKSRKLGSVNCQNKRIQGRMRKICRNRKGQITSNRPA